MKSLRLAFLLLFASSALASPGADVSVALADAIKQPKQVQQYLRYLSLYAVPVEAREETRKVIAFHINSLSREPDLVPPTKVSDTLLRINLFDYGISREVWEKLAEVEPYYHAKIEAVKVEVIPEFKDERFSYDGGVTWQTRKVKVGEKKVEKAKATTAHAPWLPSKEIAELALALNSDVPIVRGDWFFFQTSTQHALGPGYYDFLGLGKKETDFQELVGADIKLARKRKKESAAVVARSTVTLNNRSLERFGAFDGAYWRSHDFKTNVLKQNVIRLLDGDLDPPNGDASEQYGSLPNGLFAFWLQNDKGERQDAAPDFIASDGLSTSTDRRVRIGISCMRCHEEGIRPINDWMRAVYRGPVQLASSDYEKLRRLQQLYLSDLNEQIEHDNQVYAKRLLKVNGLKPQQNARAVATVWQRYADADLGIEAVAHEAGVGKDVLLAALKTYGKSYPGADPILLGLLAGEVQPIRREHWEEVFSLLQVVLKGVKP